MGPTGQPFTQEKARELATYDQLVLICGHYEGVDYRVEEHLVDETISIGNGTSIAQKLKNIDGVLSIKAASDDVSTNFEDPEFTGIVKALKHHINIGDVFQIVPSRRFH